MTITWNTARTAGTAGLVSAALLLADMIGSPELGEPGDPAATLVHHSQAAGGGVALWGAIGGLSVIALVVMVTSIGRLCGAATCTVVSVVGAAGLFVAVGLDHVAGVATYYVAGHVPNPADTVTALAAVRFAATPLASLSIAVTLGAVALAGGRRRVLSRPVTVFAGVVAALNLLGAVSGSASGTFALNEGLFVFLGLFGFLLWDLSAATSLLRRNRRLPAATVTDATQRLVQPRVSA